MVQVVRVDPRSSCDGMCPLPVSRSVGPSPASSWCYCGMPFLCVQTADHGAVRKAAEKKSRVKLIHLIGQ